MRVSLIAAMLAAFFILTACAPEVGSETWCKMLKDKPTGEWTANEAKDYTRHCVF